MFARFDENPAMTLRVIKETKRYGRTDARTDNVKTVYTLQTKFAGGIKMFKSSFMLFSKEFIHVLMLKHILGLAKFFVHYLFFGQIGTSKTFFGHRYLTAIYLSLAKYHILLFPHP